MYEPRFRIRLLSREGALALLALAAGIVVVATAASLLIGNRPSNATTAQGDRVHASGGAALPRTRPKAMKTKAAAVSVKIAMAATPQPKKTSSTPAAPKPLTPGEIAFAQEQALSYGQMMSRWNPTVTAAAKRFRIPPVWVRAVMQIESGGRTMSGPEQPITSSAGAQGLMQLMPETYDEMRKEHGLGADPFDPHDNIFAGAAYLAWLRGKYGYPEMFAAYNDGPGHLDQRLAAAQLLPLETRNYLGDITAMLNGKRGHGAALARLTRPNGEAVMVDAGAVSSLRAPFPGEYAPGVLAVITTGKLRQGVTESVPRARAILRAHGAGI